MLICQFCILAYLDRKVVVAAKLVPKDLGPQTSIKNVAHSYELIRVNFYLKVVFSELDPPLCLRNFTTLLSLSTACFYNFTTNTVDRHIIAIMT